MKSYGEGKLPSNFNANPNVGGTAKGNSGGTQVNKAMMSTAKDTVFLETVGNTNKEKPNMSVFTRVNDTPNVGGTLKGNN